MKLKDITMTAMFTALICVGAYIRIPLPLCPLVMQFPLTILAGLLLGRNRGLMSVLCFLLIGLLGVPVFSGGGGIGYIFQPTFGFILGYCGAAYLTGWIAEQGEPTFRRLLLAGLAAIVLVYVVGLLYYFCISKYYLGSDVGIWAMIVSCWLVPLPKDIAMCFLLAAVARNVLPRIRRMEQTA